MSIRAPPAASVLATSSFPASTSSSSSTSLAKTDKDQPAPSTFETYAGVEWSSRRFLTWWIAAFGVATAARVACFEPAIFGNYLLKNLGPLERDKVGYSTILGVRAWDLLVGGIAWRFVEGVTRKDGALFGFIVTLISRVSLYTFEHTYLLLSRATTSTLLLTDIISLSLAFSLLPKFLPHSPTAKPTSTTISRLSRSPVFFVNIFLALGLATTLSGLIGFVGERVGGIEWVKTQVGELRVPSILGKGVLSPAEMLAKTTLPIPVLRASLTPRSMPVHLLSSLPLSLSLLPLPFLLPTFSPALLSILTFSLILPSTTGLLYDVFPISLPGALGIGLALATRAALDMAVIAWVTEELREGDERLVSFVEVVEIEGEEGEKEVLVVEGTAEVGTALEVELIEES
ncbi:hypothetical protein T439DRAFT_329043, partial [Meredithblackwellia eburnea MCA 4105]